MISLIYEKNIAKHLKKCVANKSNQANYFKENINEGSCDDEESQDEKDRSTQIKNLNISKIQDGSFGPHDFIPLEPLSIKNRHGQPTIISNYSKEKLKALLTLVENCIESYNLDIDSSFIDDDNNFRFIDELSSLSAKKRKHSIQHTCIIENMKRLGVYDKSRLFLEFGSGKGTLSHIIQNELQSDHILIDKGKFRHKIERLGRPDNLMFNRITIDIKDLKLDEVHCIKELNEDNSREILSFSKHLCGCATDLTLRCLKNCTNKSAKLNHILIALCCHHKCTWKAYVGKQWFRENGLGKEDFDIIKRMSSWALSGEDGNASNLDDNISAEDKRLYGIKCKRFIDIGRIKYMNELSYRTKLSFYVKEDVTPENVLLISEKIKSK